MARKPKALTPKILTITIPRRKTGRKSSWAKIGDRADSKVRPGNSWKGCSVMDEGQGRTGFGRELFLLRFRGLQISQSAFAKRFGLTLGAVKDQEQGRHAPSRAMRVLVTAIELDPGLIERAAKIAARRADNPQ